MLPSMSELPGGPHDGELVNRLLVLEYRNPRYLDGPPSLCQGCAEICEGSPCAPGRRNRRAKRPPPPDPLPARCDTHTSEGQGDWARLTRLYRSIKAHGLLFVLVDSPVLRRRLATISLLPLAADSHEVARLDLTTPSYQPLEESLLPLLPIRRPVSSFSYGLERSLISPAHRLGALALPEPTSGSDPQTACLPRWSSGPLTRPSPTGAARA